MTQKEYGFLKNKFLYNFEGCFFCFFLHFEVCSFVPVAHTFYCEAISNADSFVFYKEKYNDNYAAAN